MPYYAMIFHAFSWISKSLPICFRDVFVQFMAIIFGFAVVVKPLLICTSLMAFWMASQTWKAGAVTQEATRDQG